MHVLVEPIDGGELDRLITALLNATGVRQVIENSSGHPGAEGVAIIGFAADQLRAALWLLAERVPAAPTRSRSRATLTPSRSARPSWSAGRGSSPTVAKRGSTAP
jgi:hypothetical protein